MSTLVILSCGQCGQSFLRARTGSPARYCSKECRSRGYYLEHRPPLTRQKGPRSPRKPKDRSAYYFEYNRRPEVMERQRQRKRSEYVPHPRQPKPRYDTNVEVQMPYRGHQWLDMARQVVGDFNPEAPWADDRWDEIGEATLALLEGRDMRQAVKEYRTREFVPRHLTAHIGDWSGGDEDWDQQRWDRMMPVAPSAEDEVIARDEVARKIRYHHGDSSRVMGSKTQQPSRRRMKDAGWRKHIGV